MESEDQDEDLYTNSNGGNGLDTSDDVHHR